MRNRASHPPQSTRSLEHLHSKRNSLSRPCLGCEASDVYTCRDGSVRSALPDSGENQPRAECRETTTRVGYRRERFWVIRGETHLGVRWPKPTHRLTPPSA